MILSSSIGRILALSSSLFALSSADTLVERTSFGNGNRISADMSSLPGWQLSGDGFTPEIMSDRIIMTPPYPGRKRGAMWALDPVSQSEWTVDFEFRVNGEDGPGGNIQLWYVKNGQVDVGSQDIYSVSRFDGLAITIDSSQGRGMVRGFLNDGTTDYRTHRNVDSLAFGHCEYFYRNLGRPSQIIIKQTMFSFEVLIDKRSCFHTKKVFLPVGNTFGITASSTDYPDSFEVFKFALSVPRPGSDSGASQNQRSHQAQQPPVQRSNTNQQASADGLSGVQTQIKNIQDRLHTLSTSTERLLNDLALLSKKFDERNQELARNSANRDQVSSVDQRVMRLERMIERVQKDLAGKDYQRHFTKLEEALRHSHSGLLENLHDSSHRILSSAPRMGFFIFLVVALQLSLAGAYVFYKKRRANMPKKFL
ncbi:lectin family integral membrane protein [Coccidioides immitis RS]|uniref:Lectin family integral membrane protein n=3 Tax=Coccidioides immitis TaxID=5501 RepID=J3K2D5_COCIM|nr:lectin family integral membrane protein [Coccidioides immitis RS]EAS28240.3 lectin family integral membrane protein [Coccidioides immitis RS]KMP09073.1 hypothetical protein CIRG_08754 [Coccidioides immitis RMSCC 2394]KMU77998.1 hypothetical protein CISG_06907 [Coccidioides immitis RMSCC 3703]